MGSDVEAERSVNTNYKPQPNCPVNNVSNVPMLAPNLSYLGAKLVLLLRAERGAFLCPQNVLMTFGIILDLIMRVTLEQHEAAL